MSSIKEQLVAFEKQLDEAAKELARRETVKLTLQLWQYDVDKKHRVGTGEIRYTMQWHLPICGATQLTKPVVVQTEFASNLETHKDIVFDGEISVSTVDSILQPPMYKETAPLFEGRGKPDANNPDELLVYDLNGGSWTVKFEFDQRKASRVLKSVSLVHDSDAHPALTGALLDVLAHRRRAHMRPQYSIELKP